MEFPRRKQILDALIVLAAAVATYIVAVAVQAGEAFFEWTQRLGRWELDELPVGLLVAAVGTAWFARRRWAEQTEVRHRLESIVKLVPDPLFFKDPEGRYMFLNEAGARLFGRTADRVVGKDDFELFGDEEVAREIREIDARVMRSGEPIEYERARDYSGASRVFLTSKVPLRSRSGESLGLVGVSHDVTARKQVEQALREAQTTLENQVSKRTTTLQDEIIKRQHTEESLRTLSELMSDCCWIRWEYPDGTAKREWISGSFQRLTGYSPEEFEEIGREGLVHPDDLPEVLEHVTGPPDRSEHQFRIVTKSGEQRWLHERMRVTRTEDGTVCVFGSTRDITDKKRAEEELRASREELHQSQKLEALGKLAGGVAHDFNNLLMVIIGYGELLTEALGEHGPPGEHVAEICKAAKRATSLTAQLLVFSRKQQLRPALVDLNDLIRDMDRMLQRLLPESIEMRIDLSPALKRVEIDPGQFQQMIVNLVVNARDAMPKGGKLEIRTIDAGSDDGHVTIGVRDTGCGMEQETLDRMFEPFFTTKGPGEGTGLGLSAVYGVVKQSGGEIQAGSQPGAGTTIQVRMPVARERALSADQESGSVGPTHGTETLLLVEDEDMVRKIVRDALVSRGYHVLEASRPSRAIEICNRYAGQIHLMITDVVMPEMDGIKLAQQVTAKRGETKVLYMSGYTSDALGPHCPERSGIPLLRKPVSPRVLTNRVREMLDAS